MVSQGSEFVETRPVGVVENVTVSEGGAIPCTWTVLAERVTRYPVGPAAVRVYSPSAKRNVMAAPVDCPELVVCELTSVALTVQSDPAGSPDSRNVTT